MTEIYRVQYEVNDRGWQYGDVYFTEADDAVKHMRKFVAHEIMAARAEGCKVEYLCIFRDTVMDSSKAVHPLSQTINFKVTDKYGNATFYEYRVWATSLYDKGEYWEGKKNKTGYYWI